MKKATTKKPTAKAPKKQRGDRPLELDKSWHELEAQHDKIKMDWGSLAAQLGISADDEDEDEK